LLALGAGCRSRIAVRLFSDNLGPLTCGRAPVSGRIVFRFRRKEGSMPSYVVLMNWTDQGAKTASDTVDRYEAAKEDLAQRGVTIKDIY
jgi:hypothetical protein